MEVGNSIAAWKKMGHAGHDVLAGRSQYLPATSCQWTDHGALVVLADGVAMAHICSERPAIQLNIRREIEPLVILVNGEAGGTAKLILPTDIGGIAQSIILRDAAPAIILVCFAVKLVGTGLGHHVKEATRGATEFRSEAVGNNLKFLNGFDRDGEILRFERAKVFAKKIVGGVRAVDHQAGVVALLAAQTNIATQAGNHLRRGAQLREVAVIASRKGKIFKAFGVKKLRNARRRGVNRACRLRGYFHGLRAGLELHRDIKAKGSADIHREVLDRVGGKVRRFDYQSIFSRRQGVESVSATFACRELALESCSLTGECELCSRDGCFRNIVNGAADGAAFECLRRSGADSENQNENGK